MYYRIISQVLIHYHKINLTSNRIMHHQQDSNHIPNKRTHRSLSRTEKSEPLLKNAVANIQNNTRGTLLHRKVNIISNKDLFGESKCNRINHKSKCQLFKMAHRIQRNQSFLAIYRRLPDNNQQFQLKISQKAETEGVSLSVRDKETLKTESQCNQTQNRKIKYSQHQQISPKLRLKTISYNQQINFRCRQSSKHYRKDCYKIQQIKQPSQPALNQYSVNLVKQGTQGSIPTIKKQLSNQAYLRKQDNQPQSIEVTSQKNTQRQQQQVEIINTAPKIYPLQSSILNVLLTNEASIGQATVIESLPVSSNKKYHGKDIYNDVDEIDIEQITLSTNNHISQQLPKEPAKPVNPYLYLSSEKKKEEPKAILHDQQNQLPEKHQSKTQEKAPPENKQFQDQKSDMMLKQPSLAFTKQKARQYINKISQNRIKLQLLGQLASYFSINSKVLKKNANNQEFMKVQILPWHLLVYLFFKYYYCLQKLIEKYYRASSELISISQQQLNIFSEENAQCFLTLQKIEKSVRKNSKVDAFEKLLEKLSIIQLLQDKQTVVQAVEIYFDREKERNNSFCQFLNQLRKEIYVQVAAFIRSMNITKILTSNTESAQTLRCAAFRIYNATMILEELHEGAGDVSPCEQVVLNPSIDLYRTFYYKLTKSTLVRQP